MFHTIIPIANNSFKSNYQTMINKVMYYKKIFFKVQSSSIYLLLDILLNILIIYNNYIFLFFSLF